MHLLASREGGAVQPGSSHQSDAPTAPEALLDLGLARVSFKSGASAVALLPGRGAGEGAQGGGGEAGGAGSEAEDAVRDQVQMWALAEADLLVATFASAFASVGRSNGATLQRPVSGGGGGGGGGEGKEGARPAATRGADGSREGGSLGETYKASYVVAREGTCFPWPRALDGAPMTNVGSRFEDSLCWDERLHRRFSWSSSPAHRPPRLVPG